MPRHLRIEETFWGGAALTLFEIGNRESVLDLTRGTKVEKRERDPLPRIPESLKKVTLQLLVRLGPPSPKNPKEVTLPLLSLLDPHPFLFLLPHRRGWERGRGGEGGRGRGRGKWRGRWRGRRRRRGRGSRGDPALVATSWRTISQQPGRSHEGGAARGVTGV
jgi:hypothetical protein